MDVIFEIKPSAECIKSQKERKCFGNYFSRQWLKSITPKCLVLNCYFSLVLLSTLDFGILIP